MTVKPKRRLLLVADSKLAKFYLAEGFKITNLIKEITSEDFEIDHGRQPRKTGRFNKSSGSGPRFFDPHSDAKELDRRGFCKIIVQEILNFLDKDHYDQLILVCGPKMLGDLRSDLTPKFKNIDIKEFGKELIHDNIKQIEEEVLNELKFK